jgi:cytochrome c oxidase subunit 2
MSMTRSNRLSFVGALMATLALCCARPSAKESSEQIIKVMAKKFEFSPEKIVLKKGMPVTLELTTLDRKHGFAVPELGIRAEIKSNETTRVRIVPDKVGTFAFHCDVFCGDGHEGMSGQIVIEP